MLHLLLLNIAFDCNYTLLSVPSPLFQFLNKTLSLFSLGYEVGLLKRKNSVSIEAFSSNETPQAVVSDKTIRLHIDMHLVCL